MILRYVSKDGTSTAARLQAFTASSSLLHPNVQAARRQAIGAAKLAHARTENASSSAKSVSSRNTKQTRKDAHRKVTMVVDSREGTSSENAAVAQQSCAAIAGSEITEETASHGCAIAVHVASSSTGKL
jgi:mannitol-specific phosphotransferase system IIBC component